MSSPMKKRFFFCYHSKLKSTSNIFRVFAQRVASNLTSPTRRETINFSSRQSEKYLPFRFSLTDDVQDEAPDSTTWIVVCAPWQPDCKKLFLTLIGSSLNVFIVPPTQTISTTKHWIFILESSKSLPR